MSTRRAGRSDLPDPLGASVAVMVRLTAAAERVQTACTVSARRDVEPDDGGAIAVQRLGDSGPDSTGGW
jgi:hypothetical protein